MSDSIALDNYRNNIEELIVEWGKEAERIGKELKPIQDELDKLQANPSPSPADKKRIDELKKKCVGLHTEMDNASASLDVNLNQIREVPKNADEDEFKKIPDRLKKLIKDKGVRLGKVIITPKVDFDLKAKKIKSIGITIKW